MNLEKAICQGSHILKANKIKTSRLDSEILMSEVLGKDRKYIFLNQKKKN